VGDTLEAAMAAFQRGVEQRDVPGAEAVLDPDFALVLVQPATATMPRQRWLEVLPDYVVHDYEVEELVVDRHGDWAVALHRDRMRATVLGADRSGVFVISDVWRRGDGEWRLWRRHSTPVSAGELPGAR
jgi:ketosteroid isomerase-like protein